jgi:hypothetical protein
MALFSVRCALRNRRQLVVGETHAPGQDDAQAVEKRGLGGIGLRDATQAKLAMCCGRQHDVMRLNAGELDDSAANVPVLVAATTNAGYPADVVH